MGKSSMTILSVDENKVATSKANHWNVKVQTVFWYENFIVGEHIVDDTSPFKPHKQ